MASSGGIAPFCRTPPPPTTIDTGGEPPLGAGWLTTPGIYASSGAVTLQIANTSHPGVDVALQLVGRGLDSREARRAFGVVHVPQSQQPTLVSVPISALPVQSVGTQSATTVAMTFNDGIAARTIESLPLLYQFTDTSFSSLVTYGQFGVPVLNQSVESYFGTDNSGQTTVTTTRLDQLFQTVATTHTSLVGRYWNDGGLNWIPFLAPTGNYVGGTVVATDKLAKILVEDLTIIDPHIHPVASANVCVNWRVGWFDEGYQFQGAPEAVRSSGHLFPARFARAYLRNTSGSARTLFSDNLDEFGCAAVPGPMPNGSYVLWLLPQMQSNTTSAEVRDRQCPAGALDANCKCTTQNTFPFLFNGLASVVSEVPVVFGVAFTVNESGISELNLSPIMEENVEDVAAVYSQYLVTPNSGMLPNQNYVAYANQVCPAVDTSMPSRCSEACEHEGKVFLSNNYFSASTTTTNPFNPNARWKYTVAHEMGHQIEELQIGGFWFDYNRSNAPLLCDCKDLNPSGNTIHCLQSSEQQEAAELEGFAHFSAGNVWNDHSQSTCTFTYYKRFRDDSLTVHEPPFPVSCIQPVQWTEHHCPTPNRAAEYDWMGFYTGIGRDAQAPVLQSDLWKVYLRMCRDEATAQGIPTSGCAFNHTAPWQDPSGFTLPNAAREVFGAADPRTAALINSGNSYGITR